MQQATCYAFDNVELRAGERRLLIDGRPQPLGARAFEVLMTLLAHRNRVVSKDELLDAVWPNLVVEQNNVAVQVAALRKLLGASAITTIAGRGYKFSGGAVRVDQTPRATRREADGSAPVQAALVRDAAVPLIGRSSDVRRLAELLANHHVVAVTGPGGVGKTRVAQRLLCDVAHRYPQGSVWIDLAPGGDDATIVHTLACALGIALGPEDPFESLLLALRTRKVLVVIDHVEAAPNEAARAVQVLMRRAPGLSFLLVGQMRLRLRDEQVVRLEGLPVPPGEVSAQEASAFGAVALYVARATATDPSFLLDAHNVGPIVALCRELDGIPLAIDQAAAGSGAGAEALQQTLARSHELLPERERSLLRRLSVFDQEVPLDRLLVVAAGDHGLDTWEVLDALTELVDRSLLVVVAGEPPRYRLLASTRRFAAAQLARSGELAELQRRHLMALALPDVPSITSRATAAACGTMQHLQSA